MVRGSGYEPYAADHRLRSRRHAPARLFTPRAEAFQEAALIGFERPSAERGEAEIVVGLEESRAVDAGRLEPIARGAQLVHVSYRADDEVRVFRGEEVRRLDRRVRCLH
jgi:hypothetical protein